MTMTPESYWRWLRAGRPPFEWFAALDTEQQEVLEAIGDEHARDRAVEIGFAVADPELWEALGDPESPESQELLLERTADRAKQRLSPELPVGAPPPTRDSMGGLGARRAARQAKTQAEKDAGRRFLGRKPEGVK